MKIRNLDELWYTNEQGARHAYRAEERVPTAVPDGLNYQHYEPACSVTRTVQRAPSQTEIDACTHDGYTVRDDGLVDEFKGRRCFRCGGGQIVAVDVPWPKQWSPGGPINVIRSTTTWSSELVLAMVRPTVEQVIRAQLRSLTPEGPKIYSMHEAILIAVRACERCSNALYYAYGVDETTGYPEFSPEWSAAGTACEYCMPEMAGVDPSPRKDMH